MAEARKKQRLFVDIDGTLAVFTPVDTLETLYEQGYFLNLAPHENVVAAVKEIVANHPEIEVNILSAYLTDSQYALQEKNEWLDRYLPEIDQAHRVFVPCGSDKKEGISGGIRSDDFLLDDYTHNLNEWQPPARGIKLLNAINHTRGSWEHDRIRYDRTPTDLADGILSIMRDEKQIFDEKINESGVSQVRNALESRVTGDELLNAQDLIEELRAVGADIDENGYITVYHRTDHASEENIKSSHVMVAKEDGLFFSTVENGQNEGYGDSVVKLSIPVEKLVLDDIFSDEAHLRYPLENGIRQLDISDYLVEEREENMAQERPIGVKPAPTDLAEKIVNFMENYDPAFGYAEGVTGQENKEQWIDTTTGSLLQESGDNYISYLRELSEQTPEAKEEADAIILEIMNYEGKLPNLNQMPVSEVATLDFVSNPDRQGTGGLNRDSRMFEAMLLHTMEQEQTELYRRYDEAFTAANLKDDFQPKIAILQLREGEENHNRRFTSLETLDRILHEQPNCENYELVYLRNAEAKAETEQERERLNNQLYAEFNANTLRPRDYYGHSLSVGDVIVMTNDFSEQHAYYVDDMGFTKLPDDFLSHEMSAKIRNDLDIRQEGALYETIGQFEAENTLSIMDKTATDRYFQITSEYSRIFELADRRGAIMDMDALGYEPAQVDGFSDDFLMWKPKNEEENTFGFDGWDAVRDFTHDVQTLMNDYTVQQLRDRANGDYSVIEYGSFGDREVETAINNHPQDEYRRQVQAIYEYEVANNIPENDRMTKWYDEMNISVAKPWYKENDPSVMDRAVGDRRIPISEAAIAARYAEISREQQERNSPFTAENEPLVDISNLEYDEDGYLHFTVTADDYGLEGLYRIYDPANGDSMTLVSIDYGYLHPIIERQWDRIENALYDITLDRYNAMDRPTLAEDITNIKGVDRQYNAGMREMTYTFECDVRGTHDILTYEVSQHDDGEGYTIHTENNDIWESMSEPELRKLEAVLSREATYFLWQQRIENAVTVDDLREVRYGFMEAENLNLSQAQRELIWDGIDAKQIEIERSAQEMAQETNYTPIPNRYYEPDLDLDGTAEELFTQARNGYIENPDALHRLAEILEQENRAEEAERVRYMEEREREEDTNLYSVAQMKLDFMDGIGGIDDVSIEDGLNLSVMYEPSNDSVVVSLSRMEQDGNEDVLSTGAASMTLDEFKQMSRADFERFVGEVNAYNMVEQERVPSPEREQEHTHGDNIRNPFNETNFKIQPVDNGGFVVRSDSERFGNNEIVYQGVSYDECLGYIAERTDNITPHYYVIKDLASWRHDVWEQGKAPERSAVERFDTVEEAIAKFNEYKGMDYLKESVINPDNNEPMRRLALGVSYEPVQMAELDLLHTEADKTLLLSDAIGERENGYERFMTNDKFIRDLNKITSSIAIDEYSYYRDTTIEELATNRLAFLNENYPEETHTMEEAMRVAEEYVRQHPNYLRSNSVNERVAFADFTPPFLNKGESELNHGDYENITLHIRYQEPIRLNGFVAETDTITFGSQEELNKYVNGEAAYDVLDNSVMKRDNEILLYAENENGDVVWGTKEEQREEIAQEAEIRRYIAVQNEDTRYIFSYNEQSNRYNVQREHLLGLGAEVSGETLTVDKAAEKLANLKEKGFLEFRNAREVSWYATIENNTPYEEKWETKDGFLIPVESRSAGVTTIDGHNSEIVDEWQDNNASYVVGQFEDSDGTWYAAKVTDTTEQYHGVYEYEFGTDKPTRSDVEDMHLNHISEIAIDRREAEYGADGSHNFPNLNDPSPEEQAEELRQIVAEKSAPVEIDETLPPKDQLKQRLENGVRQVLDSEQFKNWLTTGGKLFYNNYSFRNAMLVWLQKPDASYVMGYEKWKDFGRNVKQGAQGAKIFIPLMASEKYKGGLFRSIKSNLTDQLSKDPSLTEASYRLGTSNLEFTMNRANHLIGFKVNGKEQQIFGSDDEAKRFIDRAIIGKVPTGFTVGTVFDAKDVIVPEYLWVKSGYTKEEIAPDEKGNPVKNRRGEVRIFNTPERQARFQTELDTRIVAKDPVKMQALFDACVAASERKGVPVSLAEKADDSTLDGGAKGYFSRQFTEDKPNGFIVIDNSLEITEKCAVLFHEMGHADLHKNLEALAKSMGEDKITREMREVQAEATAYAVASTFGIETDTSSFQYLAAYARGFELQDFQKSLDVIYRETQALTNDIKAELDIRGLNLDLTEKPKEMLNKETLETLSTKYMDFAAEQGSKVQAALNELPSLVKQSAGNPELMDVLKYQKANLDSRKADLDTMLTAIENLNTADTREKQDEIISTLDAAMNRVNGDAYAFENLSENYVVITERARGGLKVDFEQNPQKTLEAMKKDYPALAKLSEPQLQYLATSKFVAREFTKLLRNNPQEFVDKACERAALISKAASKNGTFVEVNFCEQWTDKPFFEKGTLCSPKIADKTVTGCEAQARGFSAEAEKRGDYFPFTKCDLTIFTPNKDGKLISLNTRVDIGDGAQTSLKDHLEQLCKRGSERKEVLANFTEALTERADKRKLLVQDLSAKPQSAEQPEMTTEKEGNMSREEWDGQIKDAREKAAQEQREKAAEKAQNKSNRDRAE